MIGDTEHLPLRGMQAIVEIDGHRARVALDCYFYNDRDRQFEGTFQLRLPDGASPYYFAFGKTVLQTPEGKPTYDDAKRVRGQGMEPEQLASSRKATWTEPKEARMVPREKASQAYRATVRQRVDPALMEWSGAGVFSGRVFPLEARKLHRVVVAYDMDLQRIGDDLEYRFDIPSTQADNLRLHRAAPAGREQAQIVDLNIAELPGVAVTVEPPNQPYREKRRSFYRFDNPRAETVTVRLRQPGALLLSGEDQRTGPYFAASFVPALPAAAAAGGADRGVFLLDTSLSSNPDHFEVWLKLLRAILEKNRDQLRSFAVLFFNIETSWWRPSFASNTPENVESLLADARQLALEGATDLGAALAEAAHPRWLATDGGRWDVFLLSDGASTWGESDRHALSALLRSSRVGSLFAYTTGMAGADPALLAHLTREGGGAVFSVAGEDELAKGAVAHRFRPWRIESMQVRGAADLMLAGRPLAVFPGQQLKLVGRGKPAAGSEVKLTLRRGAQTRVVSTRVAHALPSPLAPRAYGQVAVDQLEELKDATEEISTAYACHFRVTGQTSSLLMLESEEDYRRHNIKPEDHAFTVKGTLASALVAKVLQELGDSLGDPKAAFLSWLSRMARAPGVKLEIPTALKLALDKMPRESFAVAVPPLVTKDRTAKSIPPAVHQQLAKRQLDYLDITRDAEARRRALGPADALRALSSLVENSPGDTVLARDVGFSAIAMGLAPQAYHVFRRVAAARPDEPQTYHAIANLLAGMGKVDLALAYYEVALAGKWDQRFGDYEQILGMDYLRFLRKQGSGSRSSVPDYIASRRSAVTAQHDFAGVDLIVIITWNTDSSDVDLHVIEPGGEECFYGHRETALGGRLTKDVTQGYGPEMYRLTKAKPGDYQIRAKYFASVSNRASARTKVHATIYTRWGTSAEDVTEKVVTLAEGKEMHEIVTVTFK